jgi:hypothetical protein
MQIFLLASLYYLSVPFKIYGGLAYIVGCKVLTTVTMKSIVFWDETPQCPVVHRRLGKTYCLHLQGRRVSQVTSQKEAGLRSAYLLD